MIFPLGQHNSTGRIKNKEMQCPHHKSQWRKGGYSFHWPRICLAVVAITGDNSMKCFNVLLILPDCQCSASCFYSYPLYKVDKQAFVSSSLSMNLIFSLRIQKWVKEGKHLNTLTLCRLMVSFRQEIMYSTGEKWFFLSLLSPLAFVISSEATLSFSTLKYAITCSWVDRQLNWDTQDTRLGLIHCCSLPLPASHGRKHAFLSAARVRLGHETYNPDHASEASGTEVLNVFAWFTMLLMLLGPALSKTNPASLLVQKGTESSGANVAPSGTQRQAQPSMTQLRLVNTQPTRNSREREINGFRFRGTICYTALLHKQLTNT